MTFNTFCRILERAIRLQFSKLWDISAGNYYCFTDNICWLPFCLLTFNKIMNTMLSHSTCFCFVLFLFFLGETDLKLSNGCHRGYHLISITNVLSIGHAYSYYFVIFNFHSNIYTLARQKCCARI
jgi:hypothetical protein